MSPDEHCLFPLSRIDAASFKKEESEEPQNPKRVMLTQVDEQPEEISKSYLDITGDGGEGNEAKASWSFFVFDPASAGAVVKDARKKTSISAASGRLVLAVGESLFKQNLKQHIYIYLSQCRGSSMKCRRNACRDTWTSM